MHGKETINLIRSSTYRSGMVWKMVLLVSTGMFNFGYLLSVMNPLQEYLEATVFKWNARDAQFYTSLVNSLLTIGAGLGSLAAGSMAKQIGRRNTMMAADYFLVLAVLLTLVRSELFLMFGRFLSGLSIGLNSTVVPLYVNEITPLAMKGTIGSSMQLSICLGSLVVFLLGFGLPSDLTVETQWWRFMFVLPLFLAMTRYLCLHFHPTYRYDTPPHLVTNHYDELAKHALSKVYIGGSVMEQLISLQREREEAERMGQKLTVSYGDLFNKYYRRRFFIGCFVSISSQMTGVNALIFYSTKIFNEAAGGDSKSKTAIFLTALFALLNLVATILSGQVIQRVGRKVIFIFAHVGMGLCLIVIAILGNKGMNGMIPIPIMTFIVIFGLTYGPIVWIFVAEILPDLGVGIAINLNWTWTFLIAQFFQPIAQAIGTPNTFLIFGVYCLAGLLVIIPFVKETKGLTREQIERLYQKGLNASTEGELEKRKDSIELPEID